MIPLYIGELNILGYYINTRDCANDNSTLEVIVEEGVLEFLQTDRQSRQERRHHNEVEHVSAMPSKYKVF